MLTIAGLVASVLAHADAQISVGLTVVVGVCALIVILFIMAVGYTAMKMNDSQQALGLPEGSVRAMIALLLIVIWIIISVFLFSVVKGEATDSVTARIAQQVVTTIGTLVVAVAAFYFGSRSVASAAQALTSVRQLPPIIEKIDPNSGSVGKDVELTITGANFQTPTVKLVNSTTNESIANKDNLMSNSTTIKCSIPIGSTAKPGKWAVSVMNQDGQEHQLKDAFEMQPSP